MLRIGLGLLISFVGIASVSALPTKAAKSNTVDLVITAFQELGGVYVDGMKLVLPYAEIFNQTDRVALPSTSRLIALEGLISSLEPCAGVIASVNDTYLLTNSLWKCSEFGDVLGWYELGFDDTAWPNAVEYGSNGNHATCTQKRQFADISSTAQWIWSADLESYAVYCRGYLPVCDSSPCQNNGTCLQNNINMCRCLPQFTGTYCETDMLATPETTVMTTLSETTEGITTSIGQTTEVTTQETTTPDITTPETTTPETMTTETTTPDITTPETTTPETTTTETTIPETTTPETTTPEATTPETTTPDTTTPETATPETTTPEITTPEETTPATTTPTPGATMSSTTSTPTVTTPSVPTTTQPSTESGATTIPQSTTSTPVHSTSQSFGSNSTTTACGHTTCPSTSFPICTTDDYCNGMLEKPGSSIEHCACPADYLNVNNNCCMSQNWIIGLCCICAAILILIFIIIICCVCRSDSSDKSSIGDSVEDLIQRDHHIAEAHSMDLSHVSERQKSHHKKPEDGIVDAHGVGLNEVARHAAEAGHPAGERAHHVPEDRRASLASAALAANALRRLSLPAEHPHLAQYPNYAVPRRRGQPAYRSMMERGRREDFIYNPLMVELLSNDIYRHFRPSLGGIPTNVDYSIQRPEIELEFLYNELYGSDLHRGIYDYSSSPWNMNMNMNMRP